MKTALAVLAALALASCADAGIRQTTLVPGDRPIPSRYHAWLAAAKVPTPIGEVRLSLAPCPGEEAAPSSPGCADPEAVYVACDFIRPRCSRVEERRVFLHEIGHVFDARHLSGLERYVLKRLLGFGAAREWWAGEHHESPGEAFADAYADCATLERGRNLDVCDFIRRAASSRGLDTRVSLV